MTAMNHSEDRSGRLIGLLGSGEFLTWAADVDRYLLEAARSGDGSVVILPTASAPEGDDVFNRWGRMGLEHYEGLGLTARVIELRTREDACDESIVAQIGDASLVFFSGGNPAYLSATLRDTPMLTALIEGMDAGVALAGCSAGACMFGDVAPDPTRMGSMEEVFTSRGLSLLPGIVFGAHWNELDEYYPGLRDLSLTHVPAGSRMVGLDEDTGIACDGDGSWKVFGHRGVHVYPPGSSAPVSYSAGDTFTL